MKASSRIACGVIVTLLLSPPLAYAHSGKTDANGCHTNKKTGEFHCHNEPSGSKTAKTEARTEARTEGRSTASIFCDADIYNCADFSTHAEAQKLYETCLQKANKDVHRLDGDKDGSVCEEL